MDSRNSLEVIPGAGRLMGSLRDMGYEFPTAVADLVDNSIEAGAGRIAIDIEFEGEKSWVRIADDGRGMTGKQLLEAMRYGSSRAYSEEDLGKFGLGLKVASLSQCRRLSVASSRGRERAEVSAYCWDLGHIQKTDRWELVGIDRNGRSAALFEPLRSSSGTVVLWELLDRILAYEYPNGESARRRLNMMAREVEGHLAMVFHRFLAGEVKGRQPLMITVNGAQVMPWDPFARDESATRTLEPVIIPVLHGQKRGQVKLEPFVLPHQAEFSTAESFRRTSGPANWNQQQGFYIYRADRLIQCGGWSRIRTNDEHTKLARIALSFSPQLDDAFRVNVAKMRVQLPSSLRDPIAEAVFPISRIANEAYRRTSMKLAKDGVVLHGALEEGRGGRAVAGTDRAADIAMRRAVQKLLQAADGTERRIIRRVADRLRSK